MHACVCEYLEICAQVCLCGKIDLEIFHVHRFVQTLKFYTCLCVACVPGVKLRNFMFVFVHVRKLRNFRYVCACGCLCLETYQLSDSSLFMNCARANKL